MEIIWVWALTRGGIRTISMFIFSRFIPIVFGISQLVLIIDEDKDFGAPQLAHPTFYAKHYMIYKLYNTIYIECYPTRIFQIVSNTDVFF